jgi:hypothetical protein
MIARMSRRPNQPRYWLTGLRCLNNLIACQTDHGQRSSNGTVAARRKEKGPTLAWRCQGSDICATHNTFDGLNRVTFEPVIDADVRRDIAFPCTVDKVTERLTRSISGGAKSPGTRNATAGRKSFYAGHEWVASRLLSNRGPSGRLANVSGN